jgi:hypothetical protein
MLAMHSTEQTKIFNQLQFNLLVVFMVLKDLIFLFLSKVWTPSTSTPHCCFSLGASDIVCCVLICLFALFGGFLESKYSFLFPRHHSSSYSLHSPESSQRLMSPNKPLKIIPLLC